MRLPDVFSRLRLPAVAAPMFLTSGPDLVVEVCRSGIVGTFPESNRVGILTAIGVVNTYGKL